MIDRRPRRSGSTVVKRSLLIAGHATSISLEDAFWAALREIASAQRRSIAALVAEIDDHRDAANLSSAVRVFILEAVRKSATTSQG